MNPEREHIEKTVLQEYKQNLNIEENIIPDPTDLNLVRWMKKMEWKTAKIIIFLTLADLMVSFLAKTIHRLECKSNYGRAYRYFTNSFTGEILHHNIDETSKLIAGR